MAETKVFGVKVPEGLHAEASKLQKEFGTGEDFLKELISIYVVDKTKQQLPEVAEDLKELQSLNRRTNDLFLNIAGRIESMKSDKDNEYKCAVENKESIIVALQTKINSFKIEKEDLISRNKVLVNHNDTISKEVSQLTNMYKDNKALVEEYSNKNENLLKQLEKYQKYPEEVKLLNENMINLQKVNTDLNGKIFMKSQLNDDLIKKSNELNSKLTNVKIEHDEEITKFVVAAENVELQYKKTIKQKYDENIIALKKLIEDNSREKDAEKRDEILSLKEEQQTKLLLIQDEYAAKINDYQTNYKLILDELEKAKAMKETVSKKARNANSIIKDDTINNK